MSVLSTLPITICDQVKTAMPGLKSCEVHWGKLDLTELKKRGIATPGILIAPQGLREKQHYAGSALAFGLSMAAYIATRGGRKEAVAADLSAGLLKLVPGNDWGLNDVGAAEDLRWHVLDTPQIRDTGLTLWAVTWLQPITFFSLDIAEVGVSLHVAQAPAIGAAHEGDYEKIGGQD